MIDFSNKHIDYCSFLCPEFAKAEFFKKLWYKEYTKVAKFNFYNVCEYVNLNTSSEAAIGYFLSK